MSAAADAQVRLFVAVELPDEIRGALARWGSVLTAADPGLRAVAVEGFHITLCFLGLRPRAEIDGIGAACARAAVPPAPELSLGPVLRLPTRGARVVAVRIEDRSRGLARLQERLSMELSALGVYRPEARPFLPHVTIARCRRAHRYGDGSPRATPRPVGTLPFTAPTVTLFASGAQGYEPLRSAFLDRPQ